jgi:hypothetical protein
LIVEIYKQNFLLLSTEMFYKLGARMIIFGKFTRKRDFIMFTNDYKI